MKISHYIKLNKGLRLAGFLSVLLFSVIFGLTFLPISFHQETTEATGSSDPSITMTFTNSTASVDLAVNSTNGTFAESTDATSAKFSVSTSSASGYTLSISASDDTGNLVNGSESLTSISSAISSSTFDNASYNGKWGYKPSKLNSVANTNFIQSPTTEATTLDVTDSANNEANNYTIALGARADFSQSTGEYTKSLVVEAVSNFTPVVCDNTKLCVQYDGNGLTYEHGELVNNVNYNSTTTQQAMTKYSHTPNIADDGTYSGSTYASSMDVTDTVTIDGASTLNVTIYYDTESTSFDWVSVYQSPFDISNTNDATVSSATGNLSGKLAGRNTNRTTSYTTWFTRSYTVTGDTVKFHFKSDGSSNYYGYYAVITGTGTVIERTVASGEYSTPTGTNAVFYGWSSTQTTAGKGAASQVEYTDESEIKSKMPGNNGDTKTLYAVWLQGQQITFNKDSNVSSIEVLNSDGTTAGTITTSGQTLLLAQESTYAIRPTHTAGYSTAAVTKTTGAGTINGKQFTVGAGSATISITSKLLSPIQNYNDCTSLAIGDTDTVYDTRDNEVYLIGKLADNKCWLLDNLRLDLVAHKNDLNSTNTNATNEQLAYLKGTSTGTSSDKWAMSGVSYWTSSYSYSAPQIAIKNASNENWNPDTVASVTYGDGSGKIGVYYNYCAASAGTFCWGNGTSYTGSPSSDPKTNTGYDIDGDICPAGWRMPTGGAIATGTIAKGEYQSLANAITGGTSSSLSGNNATAFKTALSTPLSGYFYNGSVSNQSSNGYFWSSTYYNYYYMYYTNANSSGVSLQNSSYKYNGYSVRCVLMPTITYMLNYNQNTTDAVSNMPSSQSTTIQDDRYDTNFTLPTDTIPSRSGYTFAGWGTSSDQGIPTYKYENGSFTPSEVAISPSDSTKTLYAIWQAPRQITFTMDNNVSNVQISDPDGNVVSTITSSGASATLMEPVTYTINISYNTRYTSNVFEKTSGSGTFTKESGYKGTLKVGNGPTAINITSQYINVVMQNYNCSNLANVGDTDYVYDTRDNEVYLIGKLADNKCWLLDNLRLDLVAHKDDLNSTNTNATNEQLAHLKGTSTGTSSDQWPTDGVAYQAGYNYSIPLIAIRNNIYSYEGWNSDTTTTSYGKGSGKIGVYYNYCAASAGTYCWGDNSRSTGSPSSDPKTNTGYDIDGDICPAGWRMPTGGAIATGAVAKGEFQSLANAITGATSSNLNGDNATNFKTILSTPLSGYFSSSASYQGSSGNFWSSTYYSDSQMHSLYVNSSYVYLQNYSTRYNGYSVRCVLMPTITYTLNYDQNTTDIVSNMPSNQTENIQNDISGHFTFSTSIIPSRSGYTFAGWGTSSDQGIPTYKYENGSFTPSEVAISPSDSTKTLYAIWQAPRQITFTMDNNVSNVQISDPDGNVVSTITSSGASATLMEPVTYTLEISYNTGYTSNTITKTSGPGVLSGKKFTVGNGNAAINVTSQIIPNMQNYNCSNLANIGDTMIVKDTRDDQIYHIGKLADGNCWMLDNLNLAGGTALSASSTDVSSYYINDFSTSKGLTKSGSTIILPESSISGFSYQTPDGEYEHQYSYVYNSGNTDCQQYNSCYSYYSWDAATLGSGRTIYKEDTDAPYSICPKGWRLPSAYNVDGDKYQTSDYYNLIQAYSSGDESGNPFYEHAGPGTIPNFVLNGEIYSENNYNYGETGNYLASNTLYEYDGDKLVGVFYLSDEHAGTTYVTRYPGDGVRCLISPKQQITFTWDSDITSVAIQGTNGDVLTTSGSSISLVQGRTYTITPIFRTGYAVNNITKTSGSGTIDGKQFTVGDSNASINITSKSATSIQNWNGCSSLAQGATIELRDTRDNEMYLVGKLADGRCWMLDNLRLDLTNSSVRAALTTSNTNTDAASLTSLRSGNRNSGEQYATTGFSPMTEDSQGDNEQAQANADYKNTIVSNYGPGSNKVGVYYNYCAASAGSYCYNENSGYGDTFYETQPDATYDICPAGWKMPSDDELSNLGSQYEGYDFDTDSLGYNFSVALSGFYDYGAINYFDSYAYLWTSSYYDLGTMYSFQVDSYSSSFDYRYRSDGLTIRCIKK